MAKCDIATERVSDRERVVRKGCDHEVCLDQDKTKHWD